VLPPGVVEVVVNGPSSTGTADESADRSQWQRWRAMQVASGGSGQPCTTPAPLTVVVSLDLGLSEWSQLTTTFSYYYHLPLQGPGLAGCRVRWPLRASPSSTSAQPRRTYCWYLLRTLMCDSISLYISILTAHAHAHAHTHTGTGARGQVAGSARGSAGQV
jgi:hypothetical protein